MEGFTRRAVGGWALATLALGGILALVAVAATPLTPWLGPGPDESLVLGLSPTGWGDVVIGTLTGALFGGAALVAALAGRWVWVPGLLAVVVAPAIAARVDGADFVTPAPLGHWGELVFGRLDPSIDQLLAVLWAGALVEMAIVAIPAVVAVIGSRPPLAGLGRSSAVVAVLAILDALLADGVVAGPWALVAGVAGVGTIGWALVVGLVGWAVATGGPVGFVTATAALRPLVERRRAAAEVGPTLVT
ncbi:MAG: hypothetical protein AB1Z55_03295 [Acidimicrobiia bacterium]